MQIRGMMVLAALTLLTLAACSSSSACFYRQADVQLSEGTYRITSGAKVVLERCSRKWQPFPDAVSNFCVLIPLEQNQIVRGAVISFGPSSTSPHLWQLNGPSHNLTGALDGELQILAAGPDAIRVALKAHTSAEVTSRWQWKFEGKDRYRLKPLPTQSVPPTP
jgi:hypothetical protein